MPSGKIIDVLTYLGKSPYGEYFQSPEFLVDRMDEDQIETAVVVPFTDTPGPDDSAHPDLYKICSHFPGRFIPFARIDPRYGKKAHRALNQAILRWGFKGVLFNPVSTDSLPFQSGVVALMERVADMGLPVIIPSGQSYVALPEQIAYLASKIPSLRIIIGHMGTAAHAIRAIELLSSVPNLYLETSLQQSPFRIPLLSKHIKDGRVMFGSGAPYSHSGIELLKIREAGLSEEELEMLLSRNARKFLGLTVEGTHDY